MAAESGDIEAEDIVRFWFDEIDEELWFKADPAFDAQVRERFGSLYEQAVSGGLDDWVGSPYGSLALILIFDQFARNMFRGSAKAFAADAKALELARDMVDLGMENVLPRDCKAFIYLPYEHSENIEDQRASVRLFEALGNQPYLEHARRHLEVIERFGRFPHRNAALGRSSTAEELEYLRAAA